MKVASCPRARPVFIISKYGMFFKVGNNAKRVVKFIFGFVRVCEFDLHWKYIREYSDFCLEKRKFFCNM